MSKEKILVVEDEEDIQELIRYNLEKEGFNNLQIVDCGERALEVLKKLFPGYNFTGPDAPRHGWTGSLPSPQKLSGNVKNTRNHAHRQK